MTFTLSSHNDLPADSSKLAAASALSSPQGTGTDQHVPAADSTAEQAKHLLPALIIYLDRQEVCLFANAAYVQWFGQAPEPMVGQPVKQGLRGWYDRIAPYIGQVLTGERLCHEAELDTVSGIRRLLLVYTPDKNEAGIVCGMSLMAIDIAVQPNACIKLHEQDRQLRRITDAIPLFIAECDPDYRIRFMNPSYAQGPGWQTEQAIGMPLSEMIGEQAYSLFQQQAGIALAHQPPAREIDVPVNIGGHFMHLTYIPASGEQGKLQGVIAAFSDASQLHRSGQPLHRREQEFKTLVENSPDVITRIDRDMRHLYVNPAIATTFGLAASSYLGKTKVELGLPQAMIMAWDQAASAVFETGQSQRFTFELIENGQMRYFSVRLIPEPDANGHIGSILGLTCDITEQTNLEMEREMLLASERRARIQAETSARARDEFLAIVSHELRAPLNGIQSWAHILENYVSETANVPLAQRAVSGIKTGIAQQVRLIEDLLDVTRMVSGKLRLVRQPLAFLPVLEAAVASVRSMASAKQIEIECHYQITAEQIHGDADRVQQIFLNLLSNAIKFTPTQGKVTLTAQSSPTSLCVTVQDNGIGISPEFLPHLFDRFSQEDTSSTRGHSGLGLGLFLAHHLIELHGGTIQVDSRGEGHGTTFSINFPLVNYTSVLAQPFDDAETSTLQLPSLQGIHILVIDDQAEAREALTVVLNAAGAHVFAAASSSHAMTWLQTLPLHEMPDMLICDIAMPDEDGYSVLHKIRTWKAHQEFSPLQRLPALALTAFSQREDRIRALNAGFQMHMSKPVVPEELIVVIANLVKHS